MPILPSGIPSDIDKYFYNRKEELIKLNSFIKTLNDDVSNQILVTGYRGVGKTLLLMKLKKELPEDILTAYIDIGRIYGIQRGKITEEKILHSILEEMEKSINDQDIPKKIYNFIKTIIPKIRNKNFDFKEANNILGIPLPEVSDDYEKLSHFVMEFPQKIVDLSENKRGFVIIIDEFQQLSELSSPDAFFWMIRSYTQKQDNVSYIFTGSTSSTSGIVDELNGSNGAFGGRMIQFKIDPFEKNTTEEYLENKVSELKFTQSGLDRFYKCTRGFPAYINSFCSIMSEGVEYNGKIVTKTFFEGIDLIAITWMVIWAGISRKEKDIIIRIIEHGPQSWNDSLKIKISTKTLTKYLNLLKNKGIITHSERLYKVEDHILSAWLKYRKEKDGFYPP